MTTSPSSSIFLLSAYPIFFSSFLAFFLLMGLFGPLVGIRPGLAPRLVSLCASLSLPASLSFWRCFLACEARAAKRFFDGPLGFLTEGIVTVAVFFFFFLFCGFFLGPFVFFA